MKTMTNHPATRSQFVMFAMKRSNDSMATGIVDSANGVRNIHPNKIHTHDFEGYFLMTEPDSGRLARSEHLQWCKARAIEYVDLNELKYAIASMASDLCKHPQTNNAPLIKETIRILLFEPLTTETVTRWIDGFN
jgi:hypothetical protein